jgi:diguanylate cyclase (GGDEF)-like protein
MFRARWVTAHASSLSYPLWHQNKIGEKQILATNNSSSDDFVIENDDLEPQSERAGQTWKILIVDDDPEVHEGTQFALKDEVVIGRELEFLHAYSAAEARGVFAETRDIAVILLDVVMERVDAGLDLVRQIRDELNLHEPRIILRTGQPGYAPETEAIRAYDINDYRTKSELTHTRLLTSVTAAIRSYEQICSLSRQRRGLQLIVDAAPSLYEQPAIDSFSEGVIIQIGTLLHIEPEGILCVLGNDKKNDRSSDQTLRIIGATGRYRTQLGAPLSDIGEAHIIDAIENCIATRKNFFGKNVTVLHIHLKDDIEGAVFINTGRLIDDSDQQLLSVFCTNISSGLRNVKLVEELRALAFYDSLSQLPNRSFFVSYLDQAMSEGDTEKTVALIDIDHFSEFNHAVGHSNGDSLLRAVAQRVRNSLDKQYTLARIAGDNFAIVGPSVGINPRTLGELFTQPFVLPDCDMPVSVTMGFADLKEVQGNGADALKAASIALKLAKANRRGRYEYYAREMESGIRERLATYQGLRQIMHDKGLSVFYQPQTNLASGRVIGVEALVRWRKNDGVFIPPDQFISIAEHSGLILDLGEFVFAESCRQLAKWQKNGLPDLRVAINVSMAQFRSRQFLPFVQATLEKTGAEGRNIEVEITESMVMNDLDGVIQTLSSLRAMGITIAIDDFGTGFSSLAYLQSLPIDRLKVDRSFVKDLGTSEGAGTIARMVVNLGNTLGLTIIGEGIETPEQETILRDWGCHEGQGFLWSPAVAADTFESWVKARQAD